jgi:hypothetical protein
MQAEMVSTWVTIDHEEFGAVVSDQDFERRVCIDVGDSEQRQVVPIAAREAGALPFESTGRRMKRKT